MSYANSSPGPVRVPTALIRAEENGVHHVSDAGVQRWRELTGPDIAIADLHGAHSGPDNYMLDEPNVADVAQRFLTLIREE